MRKMAFLALFLALFIDIAYAATIFGNVYDISLDKVNNVIVEIDTLPKQTYVAKNGSYGFDVPVGDYTIKASYYLDNVLESSASERISARDEGTFRLDLILFPSFEEEDVLLNETEFDVDEPFGKKALVWPYVLAGAIALLLAIAYYWRKGKKKEKAKKPVKEEKKEAPKEEREEAASTGLNQILKIIKEEGGRATQKDIRKKIPLSEAKISLMIAELEHEGKIKKIKKGRGNIIILK